MLSKTCFRCLQSRPLGSFYAHPRMRDGRLNKCIECTKADAMAHRLANLERVRAYDRKRGSSPHRIAARADYSKSLAFKLSHARSAAKWAVSNALRKAASTAVSDAIRDGRLNREPCFVCGDSAQAHHPDYGAPLAVAWLCTHHHARLHLEHRDRLRAAA